MRPGSTVFFGGAGLVRKPMEAARALVRTGVGGLRLIAFLGGPEVDLLVAAGQVAEVHAAAVSLDGLGLAQNYRRARQEGTIAAFDYSEGMLVAALEAGARRLPFMPVAAGLGTSLADHNPHLKEFRGPFGNAGLMAVQAIRPDFCFLHALEADRAGRFRIPGDRHADIIGAQASDTVFVTAERVLDAGAFGAGGGDLHRAWVGAVIECPRGAWPTSCYPAYGADLDALKAPR